MSKVTMLPVASIQESKLVREPQTDSFLALSESIRQHGIMNPIVVRKTQDTYTVLDGHRRLCIVKRLGLIEIPASVVDEQAQAYLDSVSITHIEPFEYSQQLRKLISCYPEMMIEQIAAKIEKPVEYLQKVLELTEPKSNTNIDTVRDALKYIQSALVKDEYMRMAYTSNIAMLLCDHYGIKDYETRNKAAKDILYLLFGRIEEA